MDYIIIALSIILLALILAVLFALRKQKPGDLTADLSAQLEPRLAQLREDLDRLERDSRRELAETVQRSMHMLGDSLAANQKTASDAQAERLNRIDETVIAKQQAMITGVNDQFRQMEARFKTFELTNEQKMDAMRQTVTRHLSSMQEDNNKRLDEIRVTVDEKLQKTLDEKMTQSFKLVSERLEEVYKGLGEMQTLASGVGDLKKVLSNVKTRGILGEYQLGAILEEILAPEQYDMDIAVIPGSRDRVEFAVRLPGVDGPVYLPIDSKFPGEAYAQLQDAYETGDAAAVKAAFDTLASRLKQEAKDIHEKYIAPPHTTNFGILFLPFEGLYAEVVNRGLVEVLQRDYQINLAGPSTMAALLNSLQMGFRTLAIQKRSHEVWTILGAVKTEFVKFEDVLTATQKHMQQVATDLDKLVGTRTRAINRRLRSVEQIDTDASIQTLQFTEESEATTDSD